MTLLPPLLMQEITGDDQILVTGQMMRQLAQAMCGDAGGVFGGHALKVMPRAAGANWSFDLNSGSAVIPGGDASDQLAYIVTNTADGENTATFADGTSIAAPATGTRIHRVVAQIRDKRYNGSWTGYDWDVLCLQDTGSGTPAVPASALPLARITITAAQSNIGAGNIADDRVLLPLPGDQQDFVNLAPQGGWSNRGAGYPRLAYRIRYLGGGACDVDLIGELVNGWTNDGRVIGSLPASYAPPVQEHIPVMTLNRTANADPPYLWIGASGDIAVYNCAGADTIMFNHTIRLNAPGG